MIPLFRAENARKTSESNRPVFKTLPDTLRLLPTQNISRLLCLGLFLVTKLCLLLLLHSLQLSLTGSLGLRTLGIHLILEDSLACLLSLGLVNLLIGQSLYTDNILSWMRTYVLNQCSLVLECVTLAQMVEFVVKVLVNLACGTVLD